MNKDKSKHFQTVQTVQSYDDYNISIALFGAEGVGKTALINRFIKGIFIETHTPTIEETFVKELVLHRIKFNVKIIDTPGCNILFPAMQRIYIQKAHAFLLLYSIADKKSFDALLPILTNIMDIKNPGLKDFKKSNIPIVVCGTKTDEDLERQVDAGIAEKLAFEYNLAFIDVSSKVNTNVDELFNMIIKMKINPRTNAKIITNNNSNINTELKNKNSNEECRLM